MSKFEARTDSFAVGSGYVLVDECGDPVAAVSTEGGRHHPTDPETGRPITSGRVFAAVRQLETSRAVVPGAVVAVDNHR